MIKIIKKETYKNMIEEIEELKKDVKSADANAHYERKKREEAEIELEKERKELRQELIEKEKTLDSKESKIKDLICLLDAERENAKVLEEKLIEANESVNKMKGVLGGTQSGLTKANKKIKELEENIDILKAEINSLSAEKENMHKLIEKLEQEKRKLKVKIAPPTMEEIKTYDIRKIPRNRKMKISK